jgi:hypothetical protein
MKVDSPGESLLRNPISQSGYVARQNVAVEYHFAEGRRDRLPELAADLADRQVASLAHLDGNVAGFALFEFSMA